MTLDYSSHPTELKGVEGGIVAERCIPTISSPVLRGIAWALYGSMQGCAFTGLWIIGHDCGHGSFSENVYLQHSVRWALHSFLLTLYFAWRSTNRRHHIYANQMELDHNYVPPREDEYKNSLTRTRDELAEDAPLYVLFRVIVQQLFRFPMYLLTNITASDKSLHGKPSEPAFGNSHFAVYGPLFRREEAPLMILSNIGVLGMMAMLWYGGKIFGSQQVMLVYVQPYLWLSHCTVMITYLHHTHPEVPKYEAEAWTFIKGATATVDRQLPFIGKHFFHNIIEYHVIHHLFSRTPHYHLEEATKAVCPLLGNSYYEDKDKSYWYALWESFTKCQWVAPDNSEDPKQAALWYRGGKMPPPEFDMGRQSWLIWEILPTSGAFKGKTA